MRRTSSLSNYDGLETRVLHGKNTYLSVSSTVPKGREKDFSHVGILALNFKLFWPVPWHQVYVWVKWASLYLGLK